MNFQNYPIGRPIGIPVEGMRQQAAAKHREWEKTLSEFRSIVAAGKRRPPKPRPGKAAPSKPSRSKTKAELRRLDYERDVQIARAESRVIGLKSKRAAEQKREYQEFNQQQRRTLRLLTGTIGRLKSG